MSDPFAPASLGERRAQPSAPGERSGTVLPRSVAASAHAIEAIGPVLIDETTAVHRAYWGR